MTPEHITHLASYSQYSLRKIRVPRRQFSNKSKRLEIMAVHQWMEWKFVVVNGPCFCCYNQSSLKLSLCDYLSSNTWKTKQYSAYMLTQALILRNPENGVTWQKSTEGAWIVPNKEELRERFQWVNEWQPESDTLCSQESGALGTQVDVSEL